MNLNDDFPFENVLPIKKTENYSIFLAQVTDSGQVIEGDKVGIAFIKFGSKKFRIKLFAFPGVQYFLVPDEKDSSKYLVLSLEEQSLQNGQVRKSWNVIGRGFLMGAFISIKIQLIPETVYLCLFPNTKENEVSYDAA